MLFLYLISFKGINYVLIIYKHNGLSLHFIYL